MTHEIDLRHFPGPGHYASDSLPPNQRQYLPLSIFALHVQLVTQKGNVLHGEQSKGAYFFRDDGIPMPRPCTIIAWRRICALGKPTSPQFYLPFLPSLREEDEVGSAIGERGSRIASLSRKSKHHIRDSDDRIIWGPVYGAHIQQLKITWQTDRSDFAESIVTDRENWMMPATSESIRDRMVFLAQHGFPSTNALMKHLSIPRIYRLLFQFVNRTAAEAWFEAYASAMLLVEIDPGVIGADFKEMCHELEMAKLNQKQESDEVGDDNFADSGRGNKISPKGRFGALSDIEF